MKKLLFLLCLTLCLLTLAACTKPAETPAEPAVSEAEIDESLAVLSFTGPETAAAGDELTYTIDIANTEALATAAFQIEMDAATVEEPIVEGLNGFMVLSVNFEEVEGKWVGETIMMNLEGVTTDKPLEIASVYAKAKATGDHTATLADATLSGYVGEDSEDWIEYRFDGNEASTKIG